MIRFKKIILVFLLAVFLFQATPIFALEINYPSVPGAENPNQIQKRIDEGTLSRKDSFPLIINYFFRFFFALALAIAVAVIIYGGILYLISGAKPAVLVTARSRISQGILGLAIISCSYLVLGLINPQLLSFKIDYQTFPVISFPSGDESREVVFFQNPTGTILAEIIKDLNEEVELEGFGKHRKAEIPFLKLQTTVGNVISVTEELKNLLAKCKCGESISHTEWDNFKGRCVGGLDAIKEEEHWLLEVAKEKIKGGINTCFTRCQTCGNDCDLKEVEEGGKIKIKREELMGLLAELQTQKLNFTTDQIGLIEKVLDLNATNFLSSNFIDVVFQSDFEAQKRDLEAEGYIVSIEKDERFPEPEKITMSPYIPDTWTGYAVVEKSIYSLYPVFLTDWNQKVKKESERINLSSVLAQMTLEDIQNMIQSCLSAAFGAGTFILDENEFMEIVKEGINEGAIGYFEGITGRLAQDSINDFCQKLEKGINKKMEEDVGKNVGQCKANCGTGTTEPEISCQAKCGEKTIPPNFLSNALNNLLTKDIKDKMPDSIKERYNEKLREIIFGDELNKIISQDMVDILDKVLKGALSKSIEDQIPFLAKNLNKSMATALPNFVFGFLNTVDIFLKSHLEGLKERISDGVSDVVQRLTNYFLAIASSNTESYKRENPDLFREYLSIDECQTTGGGYYNEGYFYDGDAHKCLKATPEDLNKRSFFEYTLFPFTFPDSSWLYENREDICRGVGYCWYTNKCQECGGETIININLDEESCKNLTGKSYNGGYYYVTLENKCFKATPEDLNREAFFDLPYISWSFEIDREGICEAAGYSWYSYKEGDEGYVEGEKNEGCQKKHSTFKDATASFRDVLKNLGGAFLGGLINFAEQFAVALIQTSAHTLTQFANVWIEDEIIAPLQPYLTQLSDFQKKLHEFLGSTVRDLLPKQVAQYLSSNVEQIITDLCQKAKAGQPLKLYDGTQLSLTDDSGGRLTYEEAEKTLCHIDEEFHQSILDNLGESGHLGNEMVDALNSTISDLLPDEVNKYLDMSFAEILFPEITNIKKLIVGTPKEVMCGELLSDYPFEIKAKTGDTPVVTKCDALKPTKGTPNLLDYLNLPYLDKESSAWKDLSFDQRSTYSIGCPFIWYACQKPLSGWNQGVGTIIKAILERACQENETNVGKVCEGKGCDSCNIEGLTTITPPTIELEESKNLRNKCTSCDILVDNSIGYSLFKYAIEENYGKIKDTDSRTTEDKNKEIRAFQWLIATFPNTSLRADINRLVEERGLGVLWISGGNSSPKYNAENANSPDRFNVIPLALVSWFTQGTTVYDILTGPQFGIMKYFKGKDYVGKNFLSQTPHQLLYNDICFKVKDDFRKDFPNWTIESILAKERVKIIGRTYSPESLEMVTTANGLSILNGASEEDVPEKRKINYMTCLYLEYAPEKMLGIDQKLIGYIQPVSLQIMFRLINDKLDHQADMPEILRALLENYLYQKPSQVLNYVGNQIILSGDTENGNFVKKTANILETSIKDRLNEGDMKTEIIRIIFNAFCEKTYKNEELEKQCKGWLDKNIGWEGWRDIQDILAKKPIDLIAEIPYEIIPNDIANISIMELMSNGPDRTSGTEDDTVFGKPYVDTLGDTLGLTEDISDFVNLTSRISGNIDDLVVGSEAVIQKSFDQAFLEAPKAVFSWIVQGLSNLIGLKLGDKIADQMAGGECRAVSGGKTNCKPGETYKEESEECCVLAEGLVCEAQYKIKTETGCQIEVGEREMELEGKTYCYYDDCQICRVANQKEREAEGGTGDCLRGLKGKDKETFTTINDTGLCCHTRDKKEGAEGSEITETMCCTNVMECIVGKFSKVFGSNFSDYLTNGLSVDVDDF